MFGMTVAEQQHLYGYVGLRLKASKTVTRVQYRQIEQHWVSASAKVIGYVLQVRITP
ncbi:hypothetical protein Pta6605_47200 [Pseudomonas amygdali pv. tabaci]|nr:hypothetical protein Pta6605_47200 [Pseudomonas amygdali pv. tabaci]